MLHNLYKLSLFLEKSKEYNATLSLQKVILKYSKDKWIQTAVNPKEKGELRQKLKIPEGENIPTSLLLKKKKQLQEKAEGDKKLSKSDKELLSQIIFALNVRK